MGDAILPLPARYYRHSGAVPPAGLIGTCLAGLLLALVGGGIYGMAAEYSQRWVFRIDPDRPGLSVHILVSPVMTLMLICVMGFCLAAAIKGAKIRNSVAVVLLGLATGFVAVYVSWVVYLYVFFHVLFINPVILRMMIHAVGNAGTWSFSSSVPAFRGMFLFVLWLAEAAVVVVGTAYVARRSLGDEAFCEQCGRWLKSRMLTPLVTIADREALVRQLEAGDYSGLGALHRKSSAGTHYTNCVLESCPNCSEVRLLTVKAVTYSGVKATLQPDGSLGGSRKVTKRITTLVRRMFVPPVAHDTLLNARSPESPEPAEENQERTPVSGAETGVSP